MGRRKTKAELREEAGLPQPDEDGGDRDGPPTALSHEEVADLNDLFELLNRNGFETVGQYSLATDGPDDPTAASFSVILPSTNDWDPNEAYEDEDGGGDE